MGTPKNLNQKGNNPLIKALKKNRKPFKKMGTPQTALTKKGRDPLNKALNKGRMGTPKNLNQKGRNPLIKALNKNRKPFKKMGTPQTALCNQKGQRPLKQSLEQE